MGGQPTRAGKRHHEAYTAIASQMRSWRNCENHINTRKEANDSQQQRITA